MMYTVALDIKLYYCTDKYLSDQIPQTTAFKSKRAEHKLKSIMSVLYSIT